MTETKRKILKFIHERMDILRQREISHISKADKFSEFGNVVDAELEYTCARLAHNTFNELSRLHAFIVEETK